MFAKLFETEIGQVLVKIDEKDNTPEVRIFFEPDGLGVCSVALEFKDDESGNAWDKADNCFEKTDQDVAVSMIKKVLANFQLKTIL